jgi:hypothetical protein
MSEWTNVPAEVRQNYACKVCGNYPDEEGVLDHGRGCYMLDENGGGSEYIDPPEHLPQPLTPAPPTKRLEELPPYEFVECDACRAKPGTPVLCDGCRHNRRLIESLQSTCKNNIAHHRQVLTAAQARIAELEGENEQLRKGAPLGPIVGAQTIVEQEIELKRLRPLQAKLAGLAGEIRGLNRHSVPKGYPVPQLFGYTKGYVDALTAAAALVAVAVGERCEENTNRENDDANDKS